MNLELITLEGTTISQSAYEVIIPTPDGDIAVFPDHESLVTIAVPGVISVRREKNHSDDQLELIAISGGVVEIGDNHVKILVDTADHGDDILESEAKAALDHALKLRDTAKDQVELEKAHQLVDRHAVRLKVADLQRRKRRH